MKLIGIVCIVFSIIAVLTQYGIAGTMIVEDIHRYSGERLFFNNKKQFLFWLIPFGPETVALVRWWKSLPW